MVAFARPAQRDIRQMLIERIYAQHLKPVANAFHVFKTQVPSACTVYFYERAITPQLIGQAGNLTARPDIAELSVRAFAVLVHQCVNAWTLLPCRHGHVVRSTRGAGPSMLPVVARKLQIVFFTILVIGFCPACNKQLQHGLVVVVTYCTPIPDFFGETGQIVDQAVAPLFFKLFRQIRCPGHPPRRIKLRLIRKRSGHTFAKLIPDLAAIRLQRHLQKFLCHARIQQIHIGSTSCPCSILSPAHFSHQISSSFQIVPGLDSITDIF